MRAQAWDGVLAWVGAGYSPTVLAGLARVSRKTACRMARDARAGRNRALRHATARRIMAAGRPTGGGWVPSVGTWRRLRALTAIGWSMADLAVRCDISANTLCALRDPRHRATRPRFAGQVARLYDELAYTPGPNRWAATRARRLGWPPPAAWDDIDDPQEQPKGLPGQEVG